jgi:hypothetical protein
MRFKSRELVLAIAIVAVFVGAFVNCQVLSKALAATKTLSQSLPGPAK